MWSRKRSEDGDQEWREDGDGETSPRPELELGGGGNGYAKERHQRYREIRASGMGNEARDDHLH